MWLRPFGILILIVTVFSLLSIFDLIIIILFKTLLYNADLSSQTVLLIPTLCERTSFLSLSFLFPLTDVSVAPCQGKGEKIKSEISVMDIRITGDFASCCVSKMSLKLE